MTFYTRFPITDLKFALEIVIGEERSDTFIPESCGWCVFEFDNGSLHSDLWEGNPRFLLNPLYTRIDLR